MSEASGRVPLPLSLFLDRTKLTGKPVPATESIRNASVQWQLIEDYRPVAESLECQLSALHWAREGILPFVDGDVPFRVNNDGLLSENSAALLFANCEETGPRDLREPGFYTYLCVVHLKM